MARRASHGWTTRKERAEPRHKTMEAIPVESTLNTSESRTSLTESTTASITRFSMTPARDNRGSERPARIKRRVEQLNLQSAALKRRTLASGRGTPLPSRRLARLDTAYRLAEILSTISHL